MLMILRINTAKEREKMCKGRRKMVGYVENGDSDRSASGRENIADFLQGYKGHFRVVAYFPLFELTE